MQRSMPLRVVALIMAVALSSAAEGSVAPAAHATEPESETGDGEGFYYPLAPDDVTLVPGDGSLQVSWSDPQTAGGERTLEYEIGVASREPGLLAPTASFVGGDTFTAVVSELQNGTLYDVTVSARNEYGTTSAASVYGTPRTVPQSPGVASAVARDGRALVSWTPPDDDGGAQISGYVVSAYPSGSTVSVGEDVTRAKVQPLPNGVSTTFEVQAINSAGESLPSQASAPVTPRGVATLTIVRQPKRRVVYGTGSTVKAAVRVLGVGVPKQEVQLLSRNRRSSHWRTVASGTTSQRGRVTLRTTLAATSKLRLRHRPDVVRTTALSVRGVVVAKRVIVKARPDRSRIGMPVVVRGRVIPEQPPGSEVELQRRQEGSWRKIASGRMVTRGRYMIRWDPERIGNYRLRVVRAGDALRAAGESSAWTHRVYPEVASDVARDILRDKRITLATVHVSGGGYLGTPKQNVVDVARKREARRSCGGGAPCGSTTIHIKPLKALREMGLHDSVTVSEIVGGVHAGGSAHYSGRALDITWVNGGHVGWGTYFGGIIDRCRKFGADEIYSPYDDPYGGHHDHVHCAWK